MKYILLAAILLGAGGCVYDPGYSYVRPSGHYDAYGSGGYYAGDGYYDNGYYDGSGYYDNGYYGGGYYGDCVNCGPSVSLGFGYGYGYGGYPYYGGYYGGGYHRHHDRDDHHGDHDHDWHGGRDHGDHDHNGRFSHGPQQAWNQPDRPPIPHRGDFGRTYAPTRGVSIQQPRFNRGWADPGVQSAPRMMPSQMDNAGPRQPFAGRTAQSIEAPRARAPRNRNNSNIERQ
ncbi:MAG: hypothetical protein ABI132_04100 [Rhodanobacteraceae bacterium]